MDEGLSIVFFFILYLIFTNYSTNCFKKRQICYKSGKSFPHFVQLFFKCYVSDFRWY